ncbi:uncharacterized protein LOC131890341 isoform X2 [Tigriopus californicus]|nr:uncharacterized protein LOC131890341 isoform X2 [Tigriopus californicus]
MRPDKKQVRHHDSRKREEKAKAKTPGAAKDSAQNAISNAVASAPGLVPAHYSQFDDSNHRIEKYARRNISSNWTKYEIPSSEEANSSEDEALTGLDFNLALESAGGADSLFQLRSEREWNDDRDAMASFSNKYFALDLHDLEAAISCIPLHQKIDFGPVNLEKEDLLLERLTEKAETFSKMYSGNRYADHTAALAQKMISKLKSSPDSTIKDVSLLPYMPKKSDAKTSIEPNPGPILEHGRPNRSHSERTSAQTKIPAAPKTKSASETTELEDWLDDFLDE